MLAPSHMDFFLTGEQMVQIGHIPAHSMYNCVIDRYYTENNMEKASKVLLEMQEFGHSPKFETHWCLINNYSNKGDGGGDAKDFVSSSFWLGKSCVGKGASPSNSATLP